MPIDFARIAALFSARQKFLLKFVNQSFERLGKWLGKRLKTITEIERASRRFPVVVFRSGALAVFLDSSQRGALLLEEPPTFLESLSAGGRAFVGGLGRVVQAVQEERILPNFMEMIERIFAGILASIERFQQPGPYIFDPRQRRASDLIGLAALTYRAFITSTTELQRLAGDIGTAISLFSSGAGGSREPAAGASSGSLGGFGSLPELLDRGARYILGAILTLPSLPSFLALLIRAGWIRGRVIVINFLQGIERKVFELRRTVVDIFFVDLHGFLAVGFRLLLAAEFVVMTNLRYFVRFGILYAQELLRNIVRFATELTHYMQFWTNLVERVRRFLEALMDFNLMPYIVPALGLPPVVLRPAGLPPRLTLGDLLDRTGTVVMERIRASLTNFINTLRWLVRKLPGGVIIYHIWAKRKLDLAQEVINQLFQRPAPYPAETARFTLPGSFPNIFDAFFGPGAPDFAGALATMARGMVREVREILDAGTDFLYGISAHFQEAARRFSHLGSPAMYRGIASRAESVADLVFGGQIREFRRSLAERRDPFEEAFISWIAGGGVHIIGQAIPMYVGEMLRYWQTQVEEGTELTVTITPTSPHIIARRVRLGRVRMQDLVIRAQERDLDDDLVAMVAGRFKTAVENAYVSGHGIIAEARMSGR